MQKSSPIGIFDSGVGGLSVAVEIRRQIPRERMIYYADCARAPWGVRPLDEVRGLAEAIATYLLREGAKLVVVACNTATVQTLAHLRATFPTVRFVGIVPAVKPAAQLSRSRRIGVLATAATARGEYLQDLFAQFVHPFGVEPHVAVPHGLVQQVERGELDSPETRRILTEALDPLLERGVDVIALGCTHFPFVAPTIDLLTEGRTALINPAPAVAAQCARVLEEIGLLNEGPELAEYEGVEIRTSGCPESVEETVAQLLRARLSVRQVDALTAAGETRASV